jgi:hypothetical protein
MFAQTAKNSGNLLFTDNVILPAEKIDYAGAMSKGKSSAGKDAIIVKVGDKNGDLEYRWRIDFKKPVSLKGYSKLCFTWESLDADIKKAGGANINVSVLTLCKDDNKLFRADPNWDASKRDVTLDKRSFLMASNNGFLKTNAVLDFEKDTQTWTDTTIATSTKQMTGIEIYVGLGKDKKAADCKGFVVTSVWFE